MTARERVRFWFDDLSTPMGRATDIVVMSLIVVACIIAVALTYTVKGSAWESFLQWAETIVTLLFIIEYALRLWVAEKRLKYAFSMNAIIDLIAIAPAFLGGNLHVLRVFRLLRIFRLIRFLETQEFFFGTIQQIHLYVIRVAFTLFSIVFVSAGLIFYAEYGSPNEHFHTFFDALYFSVVTLTTVGYGDIAPVTTYERAITLLMIVAGIVFIPWQVKNMLAHIITSREKAFCLCSGCGLEFHEADAKHCKRCGREIEIK